ncbi:hypothetical protein QBC35DRAFT_484509 [Podospora australis]|uniref:Uncharacterized protein n=1 Tax=Podospora australis TaxID=1536484 RepID=A0AAN6X1N0_9PEZI|nr:hypothetical protein QBC35DRAFT_484509 [Podospora australis]
MKQPALSSDCIDNGIYTYAHVSTSALHLFLLNCRRIHTQLQRRFGSAISALRLRPTSYLGGGELTHQRGASTYYHLGFLGYPFIFISWGVGLGVLIFCSSTGETVWNNHTRAYGSPPQESRSYLYCFGFRDRFSLCKLVWELGRRRNEFKETVRWRLVCRHYSYTCLKFDLFILLGI